ncbi:MULTISPECIES: YqaA family protein [unclassified Rhizobium]|uniref:YqaA family protein n=1 Tax=unclassified Rhizobium TaxID=2613769 RepID=UPI000EA8AD29|nr:MULTISPECIES: YqaA family protein [unclassified Rhizobium]AYG69713.1 DedA family protein [Rhizobium sp. CCGE531]AYG76088.1 DedA family protein [Rhizobium sp. CCGE532]
MLQRLYGWAAALSTSRSAEAWLAGIAFVESSIFLVPADVLFIPMVLARPSRTYRLATIATVASVAGGIAGWLMGFYAYETIARPVLAFYGKQEAFEHLRSYVDTRWIAILLLSSGFTHFPPIKVVTILSGVVHVNLLAFICLATIARGARFFLLGALLQRYGAAALTFIKKRRSSIFAISAVAVVVALLGYGLARQF